MKGLSVQELGGLALGFVVVAVILGVTLTILTNIVQGQCSTTVAGGGFNAATGLCFANSTTTASNATTQGLTGTNTLSAWLPTIAVIVAAAVVISIVVTYFRQ